MKCEDCNYYTEKYHSTIDNGICYCAKSNKETTENGYCSEYDDSLNCYDCPESYAIYYEIDDIDHYCKKYKKLILRQTRSVLYKGDFNKCLEED